MSKTRQKERAKLFPPQKISSIPILKSKPRLLHQVLVFIMLLLPVCRGLAQPWFLPTEGVDSVFLQNNSDQPQSLWLSSPDDIAHLVEESIIELAPHESKTIDISAVKALPWFQVKSYISVPVTAKANMGEKTLKVPEGRSETLKLPRVLSEQDGQLQLANLSPNTQKVILKWTHLWLKPSGEEITLDGFEQRTLNFRLYPGDQFTLEGQYPLSAYWKNDSQKQFLKPSVSEQLFNPDPAETYFLMSNHENDQSYVFHSHDPRLIAEARKEINNPELRKILFGRIEQGHGEFNRDLLNPLHNAWSWHISEVLEFGTFASQSCDGSPAIVEDNVNSWMVHPGVICFWNYKILRELTPSEISSGKLN